MASVRYGDPTDLPAMQALGVQAILEAPGYPGMPNTADLAAKLLQPGGNWCVILAEERSDLLGMLIARVQMALLTHRKEVVSVIFYVVPEKRGTNLPFRMLRMLEQWARINDADELRVGISGGTRIKESSGLLERTGYEITGYNYLKVLFDEYS